MAATIAGLTPQNYEKYRQTIFKSEADRNLGYLTPANKFGYIGGYQMGAQALESAGYLKKGTAAKFGNAAMNNPDNWTGFGNVRSVRDFLYNSAAQDDAFKQFTIKNANALSSLKGKNGEFILNSSMGQAERAGWLGATHLAGVGNIQKYGLAFRDGNGTPASEWYQRAATSVSGSTVVPPTTAPAATTDQPSQSNPTDQRLQAGTQTSPGSSPGADVDRGGELSADAVRNRVSNIVVSSGDGSSEDDQIELPIENPLHQFVSFNSLFTLSSLSADGVNYPENGYRKGLVGTIILSTGGRFSTSRVSTAFKSFDNPSGKYDYFMDNVEIMSLIAPLADTKGTNLVSIDFDVIEPYSMGQFLQSCQIASAGNGHADYSQSPYLLTLEFVGFNENNESVSISTKYFPIRMYSVNMSVTAGGCRYKVKAQAWNDVAMNDNYNLLKADFAISGETVVEMLQSGSNSLENSVNFRLAELSKQDKTKPSYVPDEIAIVFPDVLKEIKQDVSNSDDQGSIKQGTAGGGSIETKVKLTRGKNNILVQDESEVSKLGKAKFNFTQAQGGLDPKKQDAPKESTPLANKAFPRNVYKVDPTKREFIFKKGTSIINAITEVMLMSEYCTDAIKGTPDEKGFYNWFRIESQCYLTQPNNQNLNAGIHPKLLVYRVIPYRVHQSLFVLPNVTARGYQELEKEAVKRYDYIYTGKNVDVLDFKLDLNNNFATPLLSQGIGAAAGEALMARLGQNSAGQDNIRPYIQTIDGPGKEGGGDVATGYAIGVSKTERPKNSDGAGDADTYATLVAKQFQSRIWYSDTEKAMADLIIMGDPYYLADTGVGNYTNTNSTNRLNLTATNAMDYQTSEVDIIFNFRTPVDLNSAGSVSFAEDMDTQLEIPFSGLFKVISVKSNFSRGKFTQTLTLMRRPNQNPPGLPAFTVADQDDADTGAAIREAAGRSQTDAAAVNPSVAEGERLARLLTIYGEGIDNAYSNAETRDWWG